MEENRTDKILLTLMILAGLAMSLAPRDCHATPKVSVSVGEGYHIFVKDGEPSPGPASTRFGLGFITSVGENWNLSGSLGFATSNDLFKPQPRFVASVSHVLSGRTSLALGFLYQHNFGYSGKPSAEIIGVSAGPSLKVREGFNVGLQFGIAKVLELDHLLKKEYWALVLQPNLSYAF